jgi:glycosyltransferase involved in cell wall biosynthesis
MNNNLCFLFSEIGKGGAEKFAFGLMNHFVNNKFRVSVISLGSEKEYEFLNPDPSIQIFHFTRKSKIDLKPIRQINQLIKSSDFDLFICIDQFAQLYFNLFRILYRKKIKSILSPHITIPKKRLDIFNNYLSSITSRKGLDIIVYISRNQKFYMERKYPKLRKIKNYLIHNGIDFNHYRFDRAEKDALKRSLFNINLHGNKIIIQVARFSSEKDHYNSIKAFSIIKKINPLVKLLFLGDGDKKLIEELKNLISELGLQNDIIFIGFTNNVSNYLSASDLFTLTSSSIETFPLSALEALASGLPIVLTNIGGADEIVNDSNGLLVPPKNPKKIAEAWNLALSKHHYDSIQIRKNAKELYHIEIMNKKYLELIKSIIK